jgi:hypothetical protein
MYSSTLSLTSALDGVGGQCHALAVLHPGKTQSPLYRRMGGSQGRYGWVQNISPPPGFDPWTIHPVASHCTNCAILAPTRIAQNRNKIEISGLCYDAVNIFTLQGVCTT